jgi:hypothetical protein
MQLELLLQFSPVVSCSILAQNKYKTNCTELLGLFWTLSTVWYVEDKNHNFSETGSVSVLRWIGQDKPTQLGQLGRASLNHWLFCLRCESTYTTHSLTHSLWSWALLEKPPIVQPLKNFPEFYGNRRFITVFTKALHWSLSSARSIQPISSHLIYLSSFLICPPT